MLSSIVLQAQSTQAENYRKQSEKTNEERQIDRVQKDSKTRSLESNAEVDRSADLRRKRLKDTIPTKADKKALEELRAPGPEDLLLYKDFLTQKNTGIFKLFPNLGCNLGRVVRADGECENAVLESSTYSFSRNDYLGTELIWKDGTFVSDSFLSQNILIPIGNVDIESVSLNLPQAKFLVDFEPERTSQKAKEQFWQIAKKVNVNGFVYGKIAKVSNSETYLMRIIPYQITNSLKQSLDKAIYQAYMKGDYSNRELGFYGLYNHDKRRDKIIAFKIVRTDTDGAITILWKELADKKPPTIEFEKNEKLTDLKWK